MASRIGGAAARAILLGWIAVLLSVATLHDAVPVNAEDAPPLRVCADPGNLPFSNDKGEGFENKLAELIAKDLGRELSYTWFTESTGYVPNTIGKDACDLVMGYAQGTGLIDDTNPYYYTSYVLITRADDTSLAGIASLSDPRLRSKSIGLVAHTPPASILSMHGLIGNMKQFDFRSGESQSNMAQTMIGEIESGQLDAGILWGPVGGYYAARADVPLVVTPLVKESAGPTTFYGITFGIRPNEPQFKHQVNKVLADNRDRIISILQDYDVPVLDQDGQPAGTGSAGAQPGQ